MGYCNKRKRTKRRRTRSLNAIKNSANIQGYPASSDDSSVESCQQSSTYRSCCSTSSPQTFMSLDGHTIPNSIFLDDVLNNNSLNPKCFNNDTQEHDSKAESFSVDNLENDFELSSFPDIQPEEIAFNSIDDDTVHSTMTSSSIGNTDGSFPHDSTKNQYHPHAFHQITQEETASFKIMVLLDSSGAPRVCYDRLIALLKKLSKTDGFDVKKALNRETLMKRLAKKYEAPTQLRCSVINKQEVFRFCFLDMLQDLVNSNTKHLHVMK